MKVPAKGICPAIGGEGLRLSLRHARVRAAACQPSKISSNFHRDRLALPGLLVLGLLLACRPSGSSTVAPDVSSAANSSTPDKPDPNAEYNDQNASDELWMETAPRERIRSRPRSTQHRSMPIHGAEAAPCGFDDCSISDDDNPLN